jgi:C1A family cysteine protease
MFKVWHYVHNKSYDYNTQEGISKYMTFKTNLKQIEDHNRSGQSSYQKGLNHMSDMTFAEVEAFYHMETIDVKKWAVEMQRSLRTFNLDDFNDGDDEPNLTEASNGTYADIDHSRFMMPVRSQGSCGSCWAFAAQSVIEGAYQKTVRSLPDFFSTQVMVDCVTAYHGCSGGWFNASFEYFSAHTMVYERDYPYTGRFTGHSACKMAQLEGKTNIKFNQGQSFRAFSNRNGATFQSYYNLLQTGPMAVAVNANQNFSQYKSGIFDGKDCRSNSVNHAVVLIGFVTLPQTDCQEGVSYFLVRNSWGKNWGDNGHIKIKNDSSKACNITKYGYAAGTFAL